MPIAFFICVLFVQTWCFNFGKEIGIIDSKRLFIYNWPDLVDRYANTTDRPHHTHGVEIPQWRSNFGAGRIIRRNISEYRTSQFSLFKLLYERSLIDSRRTIDPTNAGSFLIPYDFGMDAIFMETNGRMRKTYCPLANEVVSRLKRSPSFLANGGHDHTLIVSVNQHMNYFFNAKACTELLLLCWNCTKLSVDEYLFVAKDRAFEMKQRGINWHAVPYPSDYHYDSRVYGTFSSLSLPVATSSQRERPSPPPWESIAENRSRLISYLGNPRKLSPYSSSLREALVMQCMNHSDVCTHGLYNHEAHESPNYDSRRSVFCLQPPGDMPTRKSVFDVILSGCIPVLFHPLTARYMYEWHWSPEVWDQVGVHFDSFEDNKQLLGQKTDFIQRLIDMYSQQRELLQKKRQAIREQAFKLQYSLIFREAVSHRPVVSRQYEGVGLDRRVRQDAYDISMGAILDIHYGERSHDRMAPFVTCKQIPGAGGRTMLQTFEECNVTAGAVKDPFHPPAVASVFLGAGKRGRSNGQQ